MLKIKQQDLFNGVLCLFQMFETFLNVRFQWVRDPDKSVYFNPNLPILLLSGLMSSCNQYELRIVTCSNLTWINVTWQITSSIEVISAWVSQYHQAELFVLAIERPLVANVTHCMFELNTLHCMIHLQQFHCSWIQLLNYYYFFTRHALKGNVFYIYSCMKIDIQGLFQNWQF